VGLDSDQDHQAGVPAAVLSVEATAMDADTLAPHFISLTEDDDGWRLAECSCGWVTPPMPDHDEAAQMWGEHLHAALMEARDGR
jgi:hypothetical protein